MFAGSRCWACIQFVWAYTRAQLPSYALCPLKHTGSTVYSVSSSIAVFSCRRLPGRPCRSVKGVIGQGVLTSQIQVLQYVRGLRHNSNHADEITTD